MSMFWQPDNIGIQLVEAAAPSSPVEGQQWYDTVNNRVNWWNGSEWVAYDLDFQSWTPVLRQPAVLNLSASVGYYIKQGKQVTLWWRCVKSATGTGTAGQAVNVSGWPAALNPTANLTFNTPVGSGWAIDTGVATFVGTTMYFNLSGDHALYLFTPNNISFSMTTGDEFNGMATWVID